MKYSEKLKDPRWQKKRLKIFERDEFHCQQCGDGESTICVHHLRYVSGLEPWDYPDCLLLTLCEDCHSAEYEGMRESIGSLVEQVKECGFLSGPVQDLAEVFNGMEMPYTPEVMAAALKWAFHDRAEMSDLAEKYFTYLRHAAAKAKLASERG